MTEPTTPPPPQPAGDSSRMLMLVLSYLGILALIPLLVEKDDHEVQWHAKHGLVLFGAWIALSVVISVLSQIPFVGGILWLVGRLLGLGYLVLIIFCIVKATKGEPLRLPLLSDLVEQWQ